MSMSTSVLTKSKTIWTALSNSAALVVPEQEQELARAALDLTGLKPQRYNFCKTFEGGQRWFTDSSYAETKDLPIEIDDQRHAELIAQAQLGNTQATAT